MSERSDPADANFNDLVVECLAAIEDSGPGAIEELCTRHPEHAAALRRRLDALADTGLLEEPEAARPRPERFGEYEVLDELGHGGMGVVYRARQIGLDREVAIKTIRPELLASEGARRRFRREIVTVAKLSHPGIVPVYASGEQDGLPWFAMEQITGTSMDYVLEHAGAPPSSPPKNSAPPGAEVRKWVEACSSGREVENPEAPLFTGNGLEVTVTIGCEIAAALDHAHRAGVLHRDIKPSNVLLGTDGHARLVDFGLARDQSGAESVELTRSGALVGSLPYMAPEQVRGEPADRRTDVYGLAATLLTWFTDQAPFPERTEAELRAAILSGRPLGLARRAPRMPADLVVVLEKGLDPDPERRYPTAGDLARDLVAVVERRPISARPASMARRVQRFARHRPATTLGLAVAMILLIAIPIALLIVNSQIRGALDRAEARFDDARHAIVDLAARVGDEALRDVPGAGPIRLDVLERSLALFQNLLAERPDDPELRLQQARLQRQTAKVLSELGRGDDATAMTDTAESTMRALLDEPRHGADSLATDAALDLADLLISRTTARDAPVLELLTEAETLLDQAASTAAPTQTGPILEMRRQLLHNRANTLHNNQEAAAALAASNAEVETADEWVKLAPTLPAAQFAKGSALSLRSMLHHDEKRDEPAERDAAAATRLLEEVVAAAPRPIHRARLGLHLMNQAHRHYQSARYERAEECAERAVEQFEAVTREQPYRRDWQRQLAKANEAVGLALAGKERTDEAVTWFARSAAALENLLEFDPLDRQVALRLGLSHYNCGVAFLELDRRVEARPHAARARELFAAGAAAGSRGAARFEVYAALIDDRARATAAATPSPAALASPVVERQSQDAEAWFFLAISHADLAGLAASSEHGDAAIASLQRAVELGFRRGDRVDSTAQFDSVRDRDEFRTLRARMDEAGK